MQKSKRCRREAVPDGAPERGTRLIARWLPDGRFGIAIAAPGNQTPLAWVEIGAGDAEALADLIYREVCP